MVFRRGDIVRLRSTGELGVIIHSWANTELKVTDYHVAFYGKHFPKSKPADMPYILRYSAISLEPVDAVNQE